MLTVAPLPPAGARHIARSAPSATSTSGPAAQLPVLVAGASGGVGQLVVAGLLARGVPVRALVRTKERGVALFAGAAGQLELVAADLRDAGALRATGACTGLGGVVCATGTTAFPSLRWLGGNPQETDSLAVRNLVAGVAAGSPQLARFVLVSSVGTSAARRAAPPYSVLNAFGVLSAKAEGEAALAASGVPFTLLRPGRLTDGPYTSYDLNTLLQATSGTRREAVVTRDDTGDAQLEASRLVVAAAAVAALFSAAAAGGAFDLASREGPSTGGEQGVWDALFAGARRGTG